MRLEIPLKVEIKAKATSTYTKEQVLVRMQEVGYLSDPKSRDEYTFLEGVLKKLK